MAITQVVLQDNLQQENLKDLLVYDLDRHMFIPTENLLRKSGYSFKSEAQKSELADVEFNFMAETMYGFMSYVMPKDNMEFILAKLAENANEEQTTIARAYIALAPFWIRGGDQAGIENGVNYESGTVIPASTLIESQIGLLVKQILEAGNGTVGGFLLFRGKINVNISTITDLVFGVDY